MKKGTLLMLSKAFVVVDNAAGDSALPRAIAEKLKLCPEMADEIAALYDGSDRDPQKTASGGRPMGKRDQTLQKYPLRFLELGPPSAHLQVQLLLDGGIRRSPAAL